jgi:hypothetical protein
MAVDYVWERFCEAVLSPKAQELLPLIEQIVVAAEHRPFNPESEEHREFCRKMIAKAKGFTEVDFSEEIAKFDSFLR